MHVQPDRLRAHAAAAADLAGVLAALGRAPGPAAGVDAAVVLARRELAEVEAALLVAAAGAERADDIAAAALQRLDGGWT